MAGRTGRIDDGLLRRIDAGRGRWCLVCGPGPFVSDVTRRSRGMGVDPAHIVVER